MFDPVESTAIPSQEGEFPLHPFRSAGAPESLGATSLAPGSGDAVAPAIDEQAVIESVVHTLATVARAEDQEIATRLLAAGDALATAMQPLLEAEHVVAIPVSRRGFGWSRSPVVSASDLAVAVAAAGVVTIVFKYGVTAADLGAWVRAIAGATRCESETLAARLWAVDTAVAGVRWRDALNVDPGLDLDAWQAVPGADAFGLAEHADIVRAFDAGPPADASPPETDWRRLIAFGVGERERLSGESVESPSAAACRYARAAASRAENGIDPQARQEGATALAALVGVLLHQHRFGWLRDVLAHVRPTAADVDATWLQPILDRVCEESSVLVLGDILDARDSDPSDVVAVREILASLPRAVEPLAALLATLEPARNRKLTCLVLAAAAAHDPNLLVRTAVGQTWYVVRNIAFVLGRIGDASVVPHLGRWARHEDERVRIEVARALGRVRAPGAADALYVLLDDRDARVRQCAVWSLATVEDRAVLPRLRQRLFEDKDFRERASDERDDLFRAYGRLADDAAFAELERLVSQRPRLGFGWGGELRRGAALALGETGRPAALETLRAQAGARDSRLRDAVQSALASIESGPRGPLLQDEDDWCEPARIGGEPNPESRFRLEADDV